MTGHPVAILIGPSGAGKTTIGKQLAAQLGCDFRDTDADVELTTGRTIREIILDDGDAAFRVLEQQAVAAALDQHRGVLALGGGAITHAHTRELLQGLPVVMLEVSAGEAIRRIGLDGSRPLLLGQPRAQWSALLNQRLPLYHACSRLRVDTTGRSVAEVVDEVVLLLASFQRLPSDEAADLQP